LASKVAKVLKRNLKKLNMGIKNEEFVTDFESIEKISKKFQQ
jgi:hypothetical protein